MRQIRRECLLWSPAFPKFEAGSENGDHFNLYSHTMDRIPCLKCKVGGVFDNIMDVS